MNLRACPEPAEGANGGGVRILGYFPFVSCTLTRAIFLGALWSRLTEKGKALRDLLGVYARHESIVSKYPTVPNPTLVLGRISKGEPSLQNEPCRCYSDSPCKKTTKTPSSSPVSSRSPRSTAMRTMPNRSNQLAAASSPSLL